MATCEPSRESLLMEKKIESKKKYKAFNGASCVNCIYSEYFSPESSNCGPSLYCRLNPQVQYIQGDDWCAKHPEIMRVVQAMATDTQGTADSQVSHVPAETRTSDTGKPRMKDGATSRAAPATAGTRRKKGRGKQEEAE